MPAVQRNQGSGTSPDHTGYTNEAQFMDTTPDPFVQNLFVLCHGEQVNNIDHVGVDARGGIRPWDPPLTARGKLQAWRVGRKMRLEDWNITRVVVSPFLRCVQTAVEVIAGLCLVPSSVQMWDTGPSSTGSVSTIKLPQGRESTEDVQYQHISTLKKIANRYPLENILCITHGKGVRQSVSMMWPPTEVHGVTHCAYTHAQRPIFEHEDGSYILNGDWELLTESGSCSGIFFRQCI